jgi:hypothetical protein
MTVSITTLSKMTFSVMTHVLTTVNMMTLSIRH